MRVDISVCVPDPGAARCCRCSKWAYQDIREVHKRRYLLQVNNSLVRTLYSVEHMGSHVVSDFHEIVSIP